MKNRWALLKTFCCAAAVYVHLVLHFSLGFVHPSSKTLSTSSHIGVAPVSPTAAAAAAAAGPLSAAYTARKQLLRAAPGASLTQAAAAGGGAAATAAGSKDDPYDIAVVGLGVGGHAACLHAKSLGLRVAAVSGGDPGGTCVNRGCIPSKALLAAARRARMLQQQQLLQQMGIHLAPNAVTLDPKAAGQYALGVAAKVRV